MAGHIGSGIGHAGLPDHGGIYFQGPGCSGPREQVPTGKSHHERGKNRSTADAASAYGSKPQCYRWGTPCRALKSLPECLTLQGSSHGDGCWWYGRLSWRPACWKYWFLRSLIRANCTGLAKSCSLADSLSIRWRFWPFGGSAWPAARCYCGLLRLIALHKTLPLNEAACDNRKH